VEQGFPSRPSRALSSRRRRDRRSPTAPPRDQQRLRAGAPAPSALWGSALGRHHPGWRPLTAGDRPAPARRTPSARP